MLEIDHDWCYSVYTTDPNGTLVEFCTSTRAFSEADRTRARELLLTRGVPDLIAPKGHKIHRASREPLHLSATRS